MTISFEKPNKKRPFHVLKIEDKNGFFYLSEDYNL